MMNNLTGTQSAMPFTLVDGVGNSVTIVDSSQPGFGFTNATLLVDMSNVAGGFSGIVNYKFDQGVQWTWDNNYLQVQDGLGGTHTICNRLGAIGDGSGAGDFSALSAANLTVNDALIKVSNPPTLSTDLGATGQIEWDANFIYVCVAQNTWKRSAISTW